MTQRQVILVGAGHAHLFVAARAAEFARRGIRLVLIDPGVFWYSGLATGMLGGMYERELDQIDPAPLIEQGGGTFLRDRVVAVDPAAQEVRVAGGSCLRYDALSLNLGSEVALDGLRDGSDGVWAVKPIANLWRLRERLEDRFAAGESLRIVVLGGGPTGCEVAANVDALARKRGAQARITVVSRGQRLLEAQPIGAARSLASALERRGIEPRYGVVAREVGSGFVALDDGTRLAADEVVLATGLRPHRLAGEIGLPVDEQGGLRVDATLRSIGDPRVFAAGDCIRLEGHDLPRLGVFGVRAAPVLFRNLLAAFEDRPPGDYRPQRRYLAILNLGDGEALAIRGALWWRGRASLRLKDWIDRRFLDRYRIAAAND